MYLELLLLAMSTITLFIAMVEDSSPGLCKDLDPWAREAKAQI